MARDRKRAKQRQRRRQRASGPDAPTSQPHRGDLPGALDHSSGGADEFDAALVRGAAGRPVTPEEPSDQSEPVDDQLDTGDALATVGPPQGDIESSSGPSEVQRQRREPLPSRAVAFLRASWAELQRMQWPDRPQVFQATGVVLGFVVVAGLYLGGADWVAQKIVNLIL